MVVLVIICLFLAGLGTAGLLALLVMDGLRGMFIRRHSDAWYRAMGVRAIAFGVVSATAAIATVTQGETGWGFAIAAIPALVCLVLAGKQAWR